MRLAPSCSVVVVFGLAACHPDDVKSDSAVQEESGQPAVASVPADPSVVGEYSAGTRTDRITTATGQSLTVQTWYPAALDATEEVHRYDGLANGVAIDQPEPLCEGNRPVMVFSHGNSGIRFQSYFLTEHLASRGWVVVAPDHEGNTLFDFDQSRWGELTLRRPVDLAQSYDWLTTELAGPGGPLAGCVDADAGYAVVGHSFGGYTAVAIVSATLTAEHAASCGPGWLCDEAAGYMAEEGLTSVDLRDGRVWASVPMTPAAYELLYPSLGQATAPMLLFGGSKDDLTPPAFQTVPIFQAVGSTPKHLAIFETAGHYTFSDACSLVPTYDDCGEGYIDIPTAQRLIRGATTAFLEGQLGWPTDTEGWLPLDEPTVTWDSVE